MILFAVNENRDIFATEGGRLALVTGLDAIVQYAGHVVRAQLGEMIYAQNRGVNTLQSLFSGSPNVLSFENSVRNQIRRIPEVIAIESFDITIANNEANYNIVIRTTFGNGVVNGNL